MRQDQESWSNPLGMDWDWSFLAEPDSDIRITFSPDLWTGEGELEVEFGKELESLALEKIQPRRLSILPVGGSRIFASRERVGEPVMTASSMKLGPDFLEMGLEGKLGIPVRESLAAVGGAVQCFGWLAVVLVGYGAAQARPRVP
jgi:hypothetical protein